VLTVAVVYRIGADWLGSPAARGGALILAVLPTAVYYGQEIRHYAWLTLSVAVMTLLFLRYLRHPRRMIAIAYAVSIAFMLYSLYLGVLILAVQVVVGVLLWRGDRRAKLGLIGAWGASVMMYIPWLIVLAGQLNILSSGIDGYPTTLNGTLAALADVLSPQTALIGSVVTIGVWQMLRGLRRAWWRLAFVTLLLSSVGILGAMLLINSRFGVLSARTLVFLTPLFAVVGGYGLSWIAPRTRHVLATALVIALIVQPGTVQPRLDYQVTAQALAEGYTPGDLIVLETGWDDNAFRYELLLALGESAAPDIVRTLPWVNNRDMSQPVVPQIESLLQAKRRVWVVNWLQPAQVLPFLDHGGDHLARVLTLQTATGAQYKALYADPNVQIVLYERPPVLPVSSPRVYGALFALDSSLIASDVRPGDRLHIDLWWSALKVPTRDYSVGVFLMNANGVVVAQQDGPPSSVSEGTVPTSA